jgi:uncharacterized protein (TIGR00375 family)
LPNIGAWSAAKGIDLIATGDFTHPAWLSEIERCLEPSEPGLLQLREAVCGEAAEGADAAPKTPGARPVRFILSTELACIYKRGGRTRRLHVILLMPSIAAVKKLTAALEGRKTNLRSDGRPILGMDAEDLLKLALEIDPAAEFMPAHVWTPWFAVFGSMSGFDSLDEAFGDSARLIHAAETGLSSDPPMNWRLSALDGLTLVSNSDAHSLRNLAREANVFDVEEPSYAALTRALVGTGKDKLLYTIEFFPEEGKYHVDGHADCGFSCEPAETRRLGGKCPKCGRDLVRGVLGRVEALADRPAGAGGEGKTPFRSVVPLAEVIATVLGRGKTSRAVEALYRRCLSELGPELDILLDLPTARLAVIDPSVAEAVRRVRAGAVKIRPGYDGIYGKISLLERPRGSSQGSLDM